MFWEWRFPIVNENPNHANRWPSMAVRKGKWKLLANRDIDRIELYDISKDVFESQNLSAQNPEIVKELMALWDEWKSELPQ